MVPIQCQQEFPICGAMKKETIQCKQLNVQHSCDNSMTEAALELQLGSSALFCSTLLYSSVRVCPFAPAPVCLRCFSSTPSQGKHSFQSFMERENVLPKSERSWDIAAEIPAPGPGLICPHEDSKSSV